MLYWYPYQGPLMPIYGSLFKELMARGHRITMITSFPHYRAGRPEIWSEYRGRLLQVTSWKGMRVIRSYVCSPVFKSDKISLLCRALNFISFNISSFFSALFLAEKPDVILAPSSPPLTNGLVAGAIGHIKGCPAVYNVQDLYPDMAEQAGLLNNPLILSCMKMIERFVYRVCDRLVVLSEAMRQKVLSKKILEDKVTVIPNFMDTAKIRLRPKRNAFAQKYGLDEKLVVMYAGNVGIPHGVEHILEAADLLSDRKDILVCIVGRGEYRDRIVELAHKKGLRNAVFPPPQPEDIVPDIWASADICLVTYRKGLADCSVPSKLLAIMSSGRPAIVMADGNSEAAAMLRRAECGLHVPPEDPYALAAAIQFLIDRPEFCFEMGQKGREWVTCHHSKEFVVDQYEKFLSGVAIQARFA
jgi:colanic acid biosynthesis glycosyl transferase WcaI